MLDRSPDAWKMSLVSTHVLLPIPDPVQDDHHACHDVAITLNVLSIMQAVGSMA